MKILLTGSHGFVGTHFRKEYPLVECWDKKIGKDIAAIQEKDLKDIDVIVHLAALISGDESWKKPQEYFLENSYKSVDLLEKSIKAGVKKFIFASSAAVYANPITPYGISKMSVEWFLNAYKDKIEITNLRFFNLYGKGQNPAYAGVISKFMESLKKRRPLTIFGDGNATRDYVYIDDVIKILSEIIRSDIPFYSDPIDVGTGRSVTVNHLADICSEIAGVQTSIIYKEPRKETKYSILLSKERFICRTPLEEGLRKLYEELNYH